MLQKFSFSLGKALAQLPGAGMGSSGSLGVVLSSAVTGTAGSFS